MNTVEVKEILDTRQDAVRRRDLAREAFQAVNFEHVGAGEIQSLAERIEKLAVQVQEEQFTWNEASAFLRAAASSEAKFINEMKQLKSRKYAIVKSALDRIKNAPPGFGAMDQAIAALSYGTVGMLIAVGLSFFVFRNVWLCISLGSLAFLGGCILTVPYYDAIGTLERVGGIHAARSFVNEREAQMALVECRISEAVKQRTRWFAVVSQHILLDKMRVELPRLKKVRELESQLFAAQAEVDRLESVISSRRYKLITTNYKKLRGTDFEGFLEAVFIELGFAVSLTKASGDQGVDLVVTRSSEVIAIQAKGYAKPVSNKAVQEVFAGMSFYDCHSCAVITTSSFTASARDLAAKVGCKLIDGSQIENLINGKVF